MKIICIEGCHGSGKTHIIESLESLGKNILDEGFLDMPDFNIPMSSMTYELIWVARWIERILELRKTDPNGVYYADRSPYSALIYAENGVLMKPIIHQMLRDLKKSGIIITICYVYADKETLWRRISDRLVREPNRAKYNEGSYEWMEKVVQFYESHDDLWNVLINNTDIKNTLDVVTEL